MHIDKVVKLGGSLLTHPAHLPAALDAIAAWGATAHLFVVPGGGPFADAVREVDARVGLSPGTAHWLAIQAMDQYAAIVTERMPGAMLVEDAAGIEAALAAGALPVLAPYRWLRGADPLPHSWEVTSDSLAAWLAGAVRAPELVLIKAPGASGVLVDPYFVSALPAGVTVTLLAADRLDQSAHAR